MHTYTYRHRLIHTHTYRDIQDHTDTYICIMQRHINIYSGKHGDGHIYKQNDIDTYKHIHTQRDILTN